MLCNKILITLFCIAIMACSDSTSQSSSSPEGTTNGDFEMYTEAGTVAKTDFTVDHHDLSDQMTTQIDARLQDLDQMMNTTSSDQGVIEDQGMIQDRGIPGQWELVWQDEFDGNEINTANWSHEVNCWGGGNNEDQCYVNDAKNSFVQDGSLHIVALKDQPSGAIGGPGNDSNFTTKGHSSARLVTQGKADWSYGRIEARLKLPCGQGLWPAFWMMPSTSNYGGWAASGEIDIMEAVNLECAADMHEVHGTLHYGAPWPNNLHTGTSIRTNSSAITEFHDYAVEWENGEIRWFLDGVHFATQSNWCTQSAPFPAPFDQSFFIILNVAIGGAWPGPPNASTTFPQRMEVDYIRVYQCAEGENCGSANPMITTIASLSQCNHMQHNMITDQEIWLYQDGVNRADWPGGNHWEQNQGKIIHSDENEAGNIVWQAQWTDVAGGGNLFIQSSDGRTWDLRSFQERGILEFRIKVDSLGNTNALYVKVDSEYPARGAVNIFDQIELGEWVTLRIPIQAFLDNPESLPLDLGSVWTPFIIEPNWEASGLSLKLDNIRWIKE